MTMTRRVKSTEPIRIQKIIGTLKSGEMSHASIVRGTGLQPGPVTKTLRALVKQGIITFRVESHPGAKPPTRAFYRLASATLSETT
jgi:DNA-binding PadR family transcriptional regulator